MADYDALDDDTLQDMLSNASSYDERSAIRQVIRKRKKERGQTVKGAESRGRSSYNRFAGSTATKSSASGNKFELPASARSESSGPPALKPVPKEEKTAARSRKYRSPSPPAVQPSPEPFHEDARPVNEETVAEQEDEEPASPEPTSPEPASPEYRDEPADNAETDGLPVTEEPAEDEPTLDQDVEEEEEAVGVAHEEVTKSRQVQEEQPDDVEEVDGSALVQQVVSPQTDEEDGPKDLQHYLVVYVNREMKLDPPLPSKGKALYDTCSDATVLCNLINKSVPGTVDLRALSKVRGSSSQRREAVEDNMTLVVESGRAIGCPVTDDTAQKIIDKDPTTITNFLVDLVRARVVHLPGMEDEPSSTFSDWSYLFEKLNISVSSGSSQEVKSKKEERSSDRSWRETSDNSTLTYEQRAAKRKAEREQRLREKDAATSSSGLTYEERAQQRKAERERRRREREALAK